MYFYSLFDYMAWYNWYYGITPPEPVTETDPEPVVDKDLSAINIAALETEQETPQPNFYREYEKKNKRRY